MGKRHMFLFSFFHKYLLFLLIKGIIHKFPILCFEGSLRNFVSFVARYESFSFKTSTSKPMMIILSQILLLFLLFLPPS